MERVRLLGCVAVRGTFVRIRTTPESQLRRTSRRVLSRLHTTEIVVAADRLSSSINVASARGEVSMAPRKSTTTCLCRASARTPSATASVNLASSTPCRETRRPKSSIDTLTRITTRTPSDPRQSLGPVPGAVTVKHPARCPRRRTRLPRRLTMTPEPLCPVPQVRRRTCQGMEATQQGLLSDDFSVVNSIVRRLGGRGPHLNRGQRRSSSTSSRPPSAGCRLGLTATLFGSSNVPSVSSRPPSAGCRLGFTAGL